MARTQRRTLLFALAATTAVHVSTRDLTWQAGAYLMATAGAAVLAWRGIVRHRSAPWPWRLLAVGITITVAGDLAHAMSDTALEASPGSLTIGDPFWLAGYACFAIAFVSLLMPSQQARRRRLLDPERFLDLGVVVVIATLVAWEIVDLRADGASRELVDRVLLATYPVADLLLLALAAILLITDRRRPRAVVHLVAGTAVWLAGDLLFLVTAQNGFNVTLEGLGWFTATWMVGIVLVGLGMNEADVDLVGRPPETPPHKVGAVRLALAFVPIAVLVILTIATRDQRPGSYPVALGIGAGLLVTFGYVRALRVLRARERAQADLEGRERYFRLLSAHSSDAVVVLDAAGQIISESPTFGRLVGMPEVSLVGHRATDFADPLEPHVARDFFVALLARAGQVHEVEIEVDLPEARRRWLSLRGVNLLDDPDVGGLVVHVHDVTVRKEAEQELQVRAFHDPLTGLANRALLLDRLEHALRRAARSGRRPAVVFLDLDGFKGVNDSLGHDSGDRLLCLVADRLTAAVRDEDTVARLGGDEFAVLVEDRVQPITEATTVADRILQQFADPVDLEGRELTVSASIGIAVGGSGDSAVSVVRNADIAMYQAKESGKGRWVVYEPGMHTAAVERLQVETDLPRALEDGQFELRYQPVIDLATGRVTGFEALLRWNHPTLGQIAPNRFIPVAEDTGMIVPLGAWVIGEACRTAARWRRDHAGAADVSIGVNVSGRQLADPGLVDTVVEVLAETGWPAGDLVLEVTETALVEQVEVAADRLTELHDLGVELAIDDFGTGYSSLTYLRLFPVDILKVDRSFIDTITERGRTPAIVRGLLDLGRTLGLQTLAEGIEHVHQLDLLRQEGYELGQGFLFAHPLSEMDAEALIARDDATLWPTATADSPRSTALLVP